MNDKPDIAIVTGGGSDYQQYVQACVNSIYVNNKSEFHVYVLDMGFTQKFRTWLKRHPGKPTVLDISKLDPYSHLLHGKEFQRSDIPYIQGMINSFRKLVAVGMIKERYFYWFDSDTLLLGDISKTVPDLKESKIFASRYSGVIFAKSLAENPISLFEKQLRKRPIQPQVDKILEKYPDIAQRLPGFNAGVVLVDRDWFLAASERHAHFFLENFSDSMFADQGYMNLVMAADGESVVPLPGGVNRSPTDDKATFTVNFDAAPHPTVTMSGVLVTLLHFLSDSKPPLAAKEMRAVLEHGEPWKQNAMKLYLYFRDLDLKKAARPS